MPPSPSLSPTPICRVPTRWPALAGVALAATASLLTAQAAAQSTAPSAARADAPPASPAPAPRGGEPGRDARPPLRAEGRVLPAGEPRSDAKAPPGTDPLERLRERLSGQLGATQAAKGTAQSPTVMRVENPAPGELKLQATPTAPRAAAPTRAQGAAPSGGPGAQPSAGAGGRGGRGVPALPSWSYLGADGPNAWATLSPTYALCGRGQRQSPIDIVDGLPVDLEPPQFKYKPGLFGVVDNGHTVQVTVAPGSSFELGGRRWELNGFHFHLPGEERIDGKGYEMSVHLTHRDAQGRIAVVALLVQEGDENPGVQTVWNHLPLERGEVVQATTEFDPSVLLPASRRHFTYMGSLTTPPCTEGVLWLVMQQPITVSSAQRRVFARLHPMNARPIQPLGGRLIKQSR
jgi:carbonic anhydrase